MSDKIEEAGRKVGRIIFYIGLCATIVLVLFRIVGWISWSWWILFLPIYGPICLALAVVIICSCAIRIMQFVDIWLLSVRINRLRNEIIRRMKDKK